MVQGHESGTFLRLPKGESQNPTRTSPSGKARDCTQGTVTTLELIKRILSHV